MGVSPVMSTPTSASDSADRSLIAVPGFVPAECTSTVSPAILRISPAAIWDLPPFLTQTNSTDGVRIGLGHQPTGVMPSSARSRRTRSSMSSRIGRTASTPWPAGSGSSQFS